MTLRALPTTLLLFGSLSLAPCSGLAASPKARNAKPAASAKSSATVPSAAKPSAAAKSTSTGKSEHHSSAKSATPKSASGKSVTAKSPTARSTGKSSGSKSGTNKRGASGSRGSHAPGQKAPTPERITEIQQALAKNGAFPNDPSGKWDENTADAMRKFQASHGLNPTGKLDALTLRQLGLGSATAGLAPPSPPLKTSSASTLPADMQPQ